MRYSILQHVGSELENEGESYKLDFTILQQCARKFSCCLYIKWSTLMYGNGNDYWNDFFGEMNWIYYKQQNEFGWNHFPIFKECTSLSVPWMSFLFCMDFFESFVHRDAYKSHVWLWWFSDFFCRHILLCRTYNNIIPSTAHIEQRHVCKLYLREYYYLV